MDTNYFASINAGNYGQKSHQEWLEDRKKSIGGSDAAAIAGTSKYKGWYALWAEKTGRIDNDDENPALREAAWLGTQMEPAIAKRFEEETGLTVEFRAETIRNPKYPYSHANIDGWIKGKNQGLEIKTLTPMASEEMKEAFVARDFPLRYYAQCLHYMAVTEAEGWYLAVAVLQRDFYIFHINREEAQEDINTLMADEKYFWTEHVLKDIPPAFDGRNNETINAVFSNANKEDAVDLTSFEPFIDRRMEIAEKIKDLKKEQDDIECRIKAEIGDHVKGVSDSYCVFWSKPSSKSIFDSRAFIQHHPELDPMQYLKKHLEEKEKFMVRKVGARRLRFKRIEAEL